MIDFYIDEEGILHRADGTKTLASAEEQAMWRVIVGLQQLLPRIWIADKTMTQWLE